MPSKHRPIEPSEILLADDGTIRKESNRPDPWARFLARLLDYSLFFLLLGGIHFLLPGPIPFGKYNTLVPFQYFLWIPVEAALLWSWGKTPGKWFLHIAIHQGARSKPDYFTALRRSFHVWVRGIGMGIPVLNALCLLLSYYRLQGVRSTSWDQDDHFHVFHRPVPKWRLAAASIVGAFGILWFRSMIKT